jgi:hypothetical protein
MKFSPYSLPLDCSASPVQLGAVETRAPLTFLIELVVAPQRSGSELTFRLDFELDIPGMSVRNRTISFEESILVVSNEPEGSPPLSVIKAVQMLSLHRISEKAWEDFEAGKTEQATKRMDVLTTRLLEAGHPELAEQAELEKQRLNLMGTVSLEGRKRLKYGTRSLMRTAVGLKPSD